MPSTDSVDKIVTRYFAVLTRDPFEFKGVLYTPRPLCVSPLLLRDYTCPVGCGACCLSFSLDYLPTESQPDGTHSREIVFSGRAVTIHTLKPVPGARVCQNLQSDGRCGIYLRRPFSCDFELIRTLEFSNQEKPNVLTQKLYGRGWNMMRVDGERGAMCEMLPPSPHAIAEVIRKLGRLQQWADHFGIRTWAPVICDLIERGRLRRQVILGQPAKGASFGRG